MRRPRRASALAGDRDIRARQRRQQRRISNLDGSRFDSRRPDAAPGARAEEVSRVIQVDRVPDVVQAIVGSASIDTNSVAQSFPRSRLSGIYAAELHRSLRMPA